MAGDTIDFRLKHCDCCKWEIPRETIKKILTSEQKDLFCENCGVDLMKENQDFGSIAHIDEAKSENNSIAENLFRSIARRRKMTKNRKSPEKDKIGIILSDPDFTISFKKNLVIVFSRIIYLVLEEIKKTETIENLQSKSVESLVNEMIIELSPVTEERINQEFLVNLKIINKEEFERVLKKLQSKIKKNQFYYVCFIEFLRDLIGDILNIVFNKWEDHDLSAFERSIIKDLKSFNHESKNENLHRVNTSEYNKIESKFLDEKITKREERIEILAQEYKAKIPQDLSDAKKDELLNDWDNLIKLLKETFERDIYLKLTEEPDLSGFMKLSMVIFNVKDKLRNLRKYHFSWRAKGYRGLIPQHKLNMFYTLVELYREQFGLDWHEIDRAFKEINSILYPTTPLALIKEPASNRETQQRKKEEFNTFVLEMLKTSYKLELITSQSDLSKKFNIDRNTVKKWIDELIKSRYTELGLSKLDEALDLINAIKDVWKSNIPEEFSKIVEYKRIKTFIEERGAWLITSEQKFNEMHGYNSNKYIKVAHSHKETIHQWSVRVLDLLYHYTWCPRCKVRKSEITMRMFMEAIFGCEFSKISLRKALDIMVDEGGLMHFDGYNRHVTIITKQGLQKRFRIAFEYDGRQHDEFPNSFHESEKEFKVQQKRDIKKDKIAKENKVIIIRLKESKGFNWKTANDNFERNILNQFYEQSGIVLKFRGLIIDKSNSMRIKKGPLDNFI